uniref:Uncharacterized protein n=1 Tax=mine drainage metagenome TaxID=410659 RepID=E6PPH4_9ZZZZ
MSCSTRKNQSSAAIDKSRSRSLIQETLGLFHSSFAGNAGVFLHGRIQRQAPQSQNFWMTLPLQTIASSILLKHEERR